MVIHLATILDRRTSKKIDVRSTKNICELAAETEMIAYTCFALVSAIPTWCGRKFCTVYDYARLCRGSNVCGCFDYAVCVRTGRRSEKKNSK